MTWRSRSLLNRTARIERAVIVYDVTTIRDRKLQQWAIVKDEVPVRLDPIGSDVISDNQMGRILVERFNAYFQGGEPVQANDRLRISDVYYLVEGVQEFSEWDWHLIAFVRKMGYAS